MGMTPYADQFYRHVADIMEKIVRTQGEAIEKAGQQMKRSFLEGHNLFAFGPGHAGMFAEEMFYRAGGLAITNPIFSSGVNCEARPITITTAFEQLPGYGRVVLDHSPVQRGDTLLIHCVAGRNPIAVEMAEVLQEGVIELFFNVAVLFALCQNRRQIARELFVADGMLEHALVARL